MTVRPPVVVMGGCVFRFVSVNVNERPVTREMGTEQ